MKEGSTFARLACRDPCGCETPVLGALPWHAMLWRRKKSDSRTKPSDPSAGRQVWSHDPRPTEAILGTFSSPEDLPDDPSKVRVYADEIDPDWADPATSEDSAAASDGDDNAAQRPR